MKFLDHFENGTHNATWTCYGYYESINRFMGTVSCNDCPTHNLYNIACAHMILFVLT